MDQAHVDQLLDPQTITRAEALGLQARHIIEGYMAGEHKSPYRGFAIEFAQHCGHPRRRPPASRLESPRPHGPLLHQFG